jgi:hypothetical protein
MKSWIATTLAAAIALSALTTPALAAPTLKLGKPAYGGPGCPAGTASASVTGGGSQLTVKFSQYQVTAGGSTGKSFDRKACSLSIPVTVPSGYSVAVVAVDFAGYTNLPSGTSATFKLEEFLPGGQGPVFSREIKGAKKGKFTASSQAVATIWSACGTSVTMRTNTSLMVRSSGGKAASASIRSQDVSTAIVYRLKYRAC